MYSSLKPVMVRIMNSILSNLDVILKQSQSTSMGSVRTSTLLIEAIATSDSAAIGLLYSSYSWVVELMDEGRANK